MMFAMPARLNGRTIKRIAFRLVLLCCPLGLFGQQFDLLIRNGRVIDGSGTPGICADMGVRGDRIALLGQAASGAKAARVIDAQGLVVAPGFIDMLEHSEWNLLIDRQAFSKLTQGITSGLTGEGDSIAPQNENTLRERRGFLDRYRVEVDWNDLNGYFRRLEKQGSGINLGTCVGATQVRQYVMGGARRAPTAQELLRMQQLVEQAMQQGAFCLSSSLGYPIFRSWRHSEEESPLDSIEAIQRSALHFEWDSRRWSTDSWSGLLGQREVELM